MLIKYNKINFLDYEIYLHFVNIKLLLQEKLHLKLIAFTFCMKRFIFKIRIYAPINFYIYLYEDFMHKLNILDNFKQCCTKRMNL